MDEETISLATLRAYLWYAANMDIFLQSIALSASHVPFIKEAKKEKLAFVPAVYANPASANLGTYIRGEEALDGLETYEFNEDKANQILDEAG